MIQPPEQYKAIVPDVIDDERHRSATILSAVLDSLSVEHVERYQPGDGKTWCQILTWDATLCLGCEVPHWVGKGELNANETVLWLRNEGRDLGWREVGEQTARIEALMGHPTIAAWENPDGHGHVAMVRPSPEPGPIYICQAGATNHNLCTLARGFGTNGPLVYFAHD
jgi:hypothetical protein